MFFIFHNPTKAFFSPGNTDFLGFLGAGKKKVYPYNQRVKLPCFLFLVHALYCYDVPEKQLHSSGEKRPSVISQTNPSVTTCLTFSNARIRCIPEEQIRARQQILLIHAGKFCEYKPCIQALTFFI